MFKALHISMVVLFVLMGLSQGIVGVAEIVGVKVAGKTETVGQSRYMQIIDGSEDCAFSAVYLIAAVGILKFSSLVRYLAIILLLWNLYGAISDNLTDLLNLGWLAIVVLAVVWFFLAPVRTRFAAANEWATAA